MLLFNSETNGKTRLTCLFLKKKKKNHTCMTIQLCKYLQFLHIYSCLTEHNHTRGCKAKDTYSYCTCRQATVLMAKSRCSNDTLKTVTRVILPHKHAVMASILQRIIL